jgi:hypothetical protein
MFHYYFGNRVIILKKFTVSNLLGQSCPSIHLNPVRAGIVEKAWQYIYSSASNYVYDAGSLKIEKADISIVDVLTLNNFTRYNEY